MPFVSIWLKLLLCHAISLIYETLIWMNLFLWFQRFYCSIATSTDNLINVKTLGGAVTFFGIPRIFFFSLSKFLWLEHRAVQWHWTLNTIQYLLQYSVSTTHDDVLWAEADTGVTCQWQLRWRGQLSVCRGHLAAANNAGPAAWATSQSQSQGPLAARQDTVPNTLTNYLLASVNIFSGLSISYMFHWLKTFLLW